MENWKKFLNEFSPPKQTPAGSAPSNPRTKNETGAAGIANALIHDFPGDNLEWAPGFLDIRKPGGRIKISAPIKTPLGELFKAAVLLKNEDELDATGVIIEKDEKENELRLIDTNNFVFKKP
jgi:hypothetical protein